MNIPILIPAYNPDESLVGLVNSLIGKDCQNIIIVNDGSSPECDAIFAQLGALRQCRVLRHVVNLGKGRAIKTGLNYYYYTFQDAPGVITVDADGQHLADDIVKVAGTFQENPKALVIGARTFGKNTPLRSLVGNLATKYIFRILVGGKISDTQSGLRCIPRDAVPHFMALEGERYEYEMNMLISTKTNAIAVVETKISTVYLDKNKSSHFNPLIDSMKIYFLLLRFSFSSIFASLVDFVIFAAAYKGTRSILISIVFARLIAGNINFIINKTLVFHSAERVAVAIAKYYTLFVIMGCIAFLSIKTLAESGMHVMAAKVVTESLLFIASFSIQRDFIFSKQKEA